MKLYEFIADYSTEALEKYLMTNCEDLGKEYILKYCRVLETLKNTLPKIDDEGPLEIMAFKGFDFDGEPKVVLEGISRKKEIDRVPKDYEELETFIYRYTFSFTDWDKCLNYDINELTLLRMTKDEIIYSILDEITELGFDMPSVTERKEDIYKKLEESEKEYQEGKYYTLEELGYKDKRTKAEKEESHRIMMECVAKNMELYYEHVKI